MPVASAIEVIVLALDHRRPVLVCGNGWSAADSMHIAGELVTRFLVERPRLKVIDLGSNKAIMTAWSNDYLNETVFARQVEACGGARGTLIAISNSANVVAACQRAREIDMTVIGLTSESGSAKAPLCNALLVVPPRQTPRIQEIYINLYHYISEKVEARCAAAAQR